MRKRYFRTEVERATRYVLPTISIQPYIKAITFSWWKWSWQYSYSAFNYYEALSCQDCDGSLRDTGQCWCDAHGGKHLNPNL